MAPDVVSACSAFDDGVPTGTPLDGRELHLLLLRLLLFRFARRSRGGLRGSFDASWPMMLIGLRETGARSRRSGGGARCVEGRNLIHDSRRGDDSDLGTSVTRRARTLIKRRNNIKVSCKFMSQKKFSFATISLLSWIFVSYQHRLSCFPPLVPSTFSPDVG